MKHCPECNRNYADPTISFCLEDGAPLIYGDAVEEPATAILNTEVTDEQSTKTFGQDPITGHPPPRRAHQTPSNKYSIIAGLIGVILVTALGLGSYFYYGRGSGKQIDSIAVMPFVNASGNPDMEYLSDGLTESLITSLARVPDLSVKARNTVFRYKGQNPRALDLGKELGVQAVLNGQVVPRGNDIAVFVELVDPATEKVLWSENYDRSLANLASLRSEISADVSQKLRTKLSNADATQLEKTYSRNPEAYRLYLLGRFHWNRRTPEGIKKAIEHFNQAIALDRNFALAYAGLADAYTNYLEDDRPPSGMTLPQARDAASKALALDDSLAEAHASLGLIMLANYEFANAEKELTRAIELDSDYGPARHWHANLLSALGRHDEALAENRRALDIEPSSLLFNLVYGTNLFYARRYDEARAQANKVIEMDPKYPAAHSQLGSIYAIQGKYAEAVDAFARSREYQGDIDNSAPKMRKSFAEGGWREYIRRGTADPRTQNFPYTMARLYLQLGDNNEAFAQLNKSYEIREQALTRVKVDPRLDSLREDPRYHELLNKVGLSAGLIANKR